MIFCPYENFDRIPRCGAISDCLYEDGGGEGE